MGGSSPYPITVTASHDFGSIPMSSPCLNSWEASLETVQQREGCAITKSHLQWTLGGRNVMHTLAAVGQVLVPPKTPGVYVRQHHHVLG